MDLTDEENKTTRKLNGAETMLCVSKEELERKIEEHKKMAEIKKYRDEDIEQYNFILGRISAMQILLEGDIDKL